VEKFAQTSSAILFATIATSLAGLAAAKDEFIHPTLLFAVMA
jgi:hypothetical protein